MDLSFRSGEVAEVNGYAPLYQAWGYRTGAEGEHERFELDTGNDREFPGGRDLQKYTDILFRNLQHVHVGGADELWFWDTIQLAEKAPHIEEDTFLQPQERIQIVDFLQQFIGDGQNGGLIRQLASADLREHSTAFKILSVSAQAILRLSTGDWDGAKAAMNTIVEESDHLEAGEDLSTSYSYSSGWEDENPDLVSEGSEGEGSFWNYV